MKNLITYLSKKSLSLGNGSGMTRKWFGNDFGMTRFSLASLICVLMLTLGVGDAWGQATLPVDYTFGGNSYPAGCSGNSLGLQGYAAANDPYRLQFNATGDYLQIQTDAAAKQIIFGVKKIGGAGNSTFTVQGSSNGSSYTDIQSFSITGSQNAVVNCTTNVAINSSYRYFRFYFTKSANLGFGTLKISKAEKYTVTFYKTAVTTQAITETSAGAGVTPPTMPATCGDWEFQGWSTADSDDEESSEELETVTLTDGKYYPSENITLYPVYTREATGTITISDMIDYSKIGISGTTYTAWSNKTSNSSAVYAGKSAGGNTSIQLNASSPNGIWTTTSGGTAKKVIIEWNSNTSNGRTIQIFGKSSAYASSDLYSSTPATKGAQIGTIVKGTSTEATLSADYAYIGLRSSSNALYLDKVTIQWETTGSTTYYYSYPTCGASCTAPTGLTAGTINSTSIQVTITDPANTGTYEIYYNQSGTAPTSGTGASRTVTTKTPTVTGFASGETYYMWVRAKCGESSKSDWVALTGSTFTTTCGDPSSTSNGATTHATTGGNGTQVLNWSGDPSNYEIYYHGSSTAPSPSQDPSRTVNGAKTETITGLTPGTYYWWVRSKCSSGKGDWVAGPSFTINGIKIGGTTPVAFGTVGQGSTVAAKTITVTGIGLTSGTNITASFPGGSPFSIDPTSVAHNADHVTLTISASTANVGAYDQNLTLSYGGTYTATVKVTMTVVRTITYSVDGEENTVISADEATLLSVLPVSPESCDDTNYPTFYGWATSPINGSTTTPPTIVTTEVVNATTAAETYYAVFAKGSQYWGRLTSSELSGLSAGTELVIVAVDQGYVLQNDLTCSNSVPAETDGKISPTDNIKWTLAGSAGAWQLKSGTDILGTQYNSCAGSGNGVVLAFNLNHQTYSIASSSHATNEFYIKDNACDYGVLTKVSKYDDIRIVNVSSYSSVASAALKLYIKKGSYSEFITNCCSAPTLAFAASPYATIRQDIGGASTTTWAEVDVTFTSNNTTGTISATTYTDGKTVYKLSSWEGRGTTGGTLCAADHAYFEVLSQPSGETPGTGKFHVKTTSGQTGQGTYRIALTQESTDESHGNFCETTVYGFVDVTLRDKFVDQLNDNGTVNRDGHGAQLATPTLSQLPSQDEDACHDEERKLKGWIREDNLKAQYETGNSTRVQSIDGLCESCDPASDQKSLVVAPGDNITTSGATWYAVWAYER